MEPEQTIIPTDDQVQRQHTILDKLRASPYFRHFTPRAYNLYPQRYYKPVRYLEEVGIEKVGELLQHGLGLLDIACLLDVSSVVFRRWISSKKEYREEIQDAKLFAGEAYAYKAEKVLLDAPLIPEAITKAKALSDHYRWAAERLHKGQYGTKVVKHEGMQGSGVVFNLNVALDQTRPVVESVGAVIDQLPEPDLSQLGFEDGE
jgi:hypothetical protein